MAIPLDGALRKVHHAHVHLDRVNREIRSFLDPKPYELRSEKDRDGWQSTRIFLHALPPPGLSLLAGDAMNNARAALDHAIYELSDLAASDRRRRKLSFPLYSNRVDYCEAKKGRRWERSLAGVDTRYWTVVERSQPFRRGNGLLGALADFDNTNKHRLIHAGILSLATMPNARVVYGGLPGFQFRSWPLNKRLHNGAEAFAFKNRRATTKNVAVEIHFEPTVAFGSRNLSVEGLTEIVNRVGAILSDLYELKTGDPIPMREVPVPGGRALMIDFG